MTEKLQQQVSAVQMMTLQAQLNPHFLFNSFNSLSSLIADKPNRAERFVEEMANVYRYLLRTNDHELTSLQTELAFIDSYYHRTGGPAAQNALRSRHRPPASHRRIVSDLQTASAQVTTAARKRGEAQHRFGRPAVTCSVQYQCRRLADR